MPITWFNNEANNAYAQPLLPNSLNMPQTQIPSTSSMGILETPFNEPPPITTNPGIVSQIMYEGSPTYIPPDNSQSPVYMPDPARFDIDQVLSNNSPKRTRLNTPQVSPNHIQPNLSPRPSVESTVPNPQQPQMYDISDYIITSGDDLVSSTTDFPARISSSPPVEVTEGADDMIKSFLQDLTAGRDVPVSEIMPDVDSSTSELKDFVIKNINFPDEFLKIQVNYLT